MSKSKKGAAESPLPPPSPSLSSSAADASSAADRVQAEIFAAYTAKPSGLLALAEAARLEQPLLPRRRTTVLIIGNHSAGKSAFVNWYLGEEALATGVAVEVRGRGGGEGGRHTPRDTPHTHPPLPFPQSTGFTIVRHGKQRFDVRAEGALIDNPHLAAVAAKLGADRKRFVDGLTLLVRKSAARDFPALDIIDTPGLVDGEISYPFDINKAIIATAAVADLGALRGWAGADVVYVCAALFSPHPPPPQCSCFWTRSGKRCAPAR